MITLTFQEFFHLLIFGGLISIVAVMIPVQIASKLRRIHRRRTHGICRICGFHFLRPDRRHIHPCPHCGANNK